MRFKLSMIINTGGESEMVCCPLRRLPWPNIYGP